MFTSEFDEKLKDGFTQKIRTEFESNFYKKYLVAEAAIKELYDMGGRGEHHFDFHYTDGLYFMATPTE